MRVRARARSGCLNAAAVEHRAEANVQLLSSALQGSSAAQPALLLWGSGRASVQPRGIFWRFPCRSALLIPATTDATTARVSRNTQRKASWRCSGTRSRAEGSAAASRSSAAPAGAGLRHRSGLRLTWQQQPPPEQETLCLRVRLQTLHASPQSSELVKRAPPWGLRLQRSRLIKTPTVAKAKREEMGEGKEKLIHLLGG